MINTVIFVTAIAVTGIVFTILAFKREVSAATLLSYLGGGLLGLSLPVLLYVINL